MSSKKQISLGNVKIGGGAPISVQTMTNSKTEDIEATLNQINRVAAIGCDLIRVSCPTKDATIALKTIVKMSPIPVIADIHFNYKRAIEAIEAGAACIRINPGNTPFEGIKEIVKVSKEFGSAIRIGINSGSIEKDIWDKYGEPSVNAIVDSAIRNCQKLEDMEFFNFKVSVKSSDVITSIQAYRKLSSLIDYPLHVGITESGTFFPGAIKSAIGIGALLADGIGDTIRVSLSDVIENEVKVGKQILKSLGLLNHSVSIVSCPTCSRTVIDVIGIANQLNEYCSSIEKKLKISVLGCVVNGIGEAKNADIGVFGFKQGIAKIYVKGTEIYECQDTEVVAKVIDIIQSFSV